MNEIIYAGAWVVTVKLNGKPKKFANGRGNKRSHSKEKLEKEINELRGKVSILDELIRAVEYPEAFKRQYTGLGAQSRYAN